MFSSLQQHFPVALRRPGIAAGRRTAWLMYLYSTKQNNHITQLCTAYDNVNVTGAIKLYYITFILRMVNETSLPITMCMHIRIVLLCQSPTVQYIEALLPLSNGVVHWSLDAAL